MIEEVTQDHVPIGPAFARSVAFDLRNVYDASLSWTEPPTDIEDVVQRRAVKQPDMMSIADALTADQQLCRALKVFCRSKGKLVPIALQHYAFQMIDTSWYMPFARIVNEGVLRNPSTDQIERCGEKKGKIGRVQPSKVSKEYADSLRAGVVRW